MTVSQLKAKRFQLDLHFTPATELEMKAIGDGKPDGFVAGWASTPGLDTYRDIVLNGAFTDSIKERGLQGPKGIKLLVGHDWNKVGGAIEKLEYKKGGLWIEAQLNLNITYAKDCYEATKSSGGMNFSVGFMIKDYSYKKDDKDLTYLEIQRGDLFEVSIVPFPGNTECTMEFVKSAIAELDRKEASTIDDVDLDVLPVTLAEFEKRLIATGLVETRNAARLVTLEVKSVLHLFAKAPITPVVEEKTTPTPLVAKESMSAMQSHLESLKAAFVQK